jgi:hypothetical protein
LTALVAGDLFTTPVSPLAIAAAVVAVLVAAVLAGRLTSLRPAPQPVRAVSLRERARRAGAIRQLDPDADGRPRPRAPSLRGPAASTGLAREASPGGPDRS